MSGKDGTQTPDIAQDALGFQIQHAKSSRSTCHGGCGLKILKGELRIGATVPMPQRPGSTFELWSHPACFFAKLKRQGKADRRTVHSVDDLAGFGALEDAEQQEVREMVEEHAEALEVPKEFTTLEKETLFWSIGRRGNVTHTRYGAIADKSQARTLIKEFESPQEAKEYAEKMLAEKKAKGYAAASSVKKEEPQDAKPAVKTEANGAFIFGFAAEYAKSARSHCKCCKAAIPKGELRVGKTVLNPYVVSKDPEKPATMALWYHFDCIWADLNKGNVKKATLEDVDEVSGFKALTKGDQERLRARMKKELAKMEAFEDEAELGQDQVYCEATSGDYNKWWGITQKDNTTKTRWGEIGGEASFTLKEFADNDAAEAYLKKMVTSKLKGAYELMSVDGIKVEEAERDEVAKQYAPSSKSKGKRPAKKAKRKRDDVKEEEEEEEEEEEQGEDEYTEASLKRLKVSQLKDILEEKGLSKSGRKADLIARLLE